MTSPPPTSLVLVGISGFWGSVLLTVMTAVALPSGAVGVPAVQPESVSAPAAARAMAATPILLIFNFPPGEMGVDNAARGHAGALVDRDYEPTSPRSKPTGQTVTHAQPSGTSFGGIRRC